MSPDFSVILGAHDDLVRCCLALDKLARFSSELFVLSKKVVVVAAEIKKGYDFRIRKAHMKPTEEPARFRHEEFRQLRTATENSLSILTVLEDALLNVGAEASSPSHSRQNAYIRGHLVLSFGLCGLNDAGELIEVNLKV